MSKTIWFTADTHFGHANIIKYCHRPFANVEAMDEFLILNWNSVVGTLDTIYHLGDFAMGDVGKYLKRLNGKIILIRGSHDRRVPTFANYEFEKDSILRISPINDEYGNPRMIVMCHYAMRSWHLSHYASWHLFGHHHGKLPPYGLSFDVGVDCWNYTPISLEEVAKKMSKLNPITDLRKPSLNPKSVL